MLSRQGSEMFVPRQGRVTNSKWHQRKKTIFDICFGCAGLGLGAGRGAAEIRGQNPVK